MTDDDPSLFSPGSRLVIHLVRLPSVAEWRAAAEPLGVSFELEAGTAVEPGTHTITVCQAALEVRLELQIAPSSDYPSDEADSAEELAIYRKARWEVRIHPPTGTPDRLPSALAVSLAAAGDGICYHSGLDRAVFGSDARTMLAELAWHSDHIDDPG